MNTRQSNRTENGSTSCVEVYHDGVKVAAIYRDGGLYLRRDADTLRSACAGLETIYDEIMHWLPDADAPACDPEAYGD